MNHQSPNTPNQSDRQNPQNRDGLHNPQDANNADYSAIVKQLNSQIDELQRSGGLNSAGQDMLNKIKTTVNSLKG